MTKVLYGLVGMQFRPPEVKAYFAKLPNGSPLTLIREPNNPHDPNAVQVWSGDVHIGYVKGSQVKPLALAMDAMPASMAGLHDAGAKFTNTMHAKLAIDGGKWPLLEVEE